MNIKLYMTKVSAGLTVIWFNFSCLKVVKVYIGLKLEVLNNLENKNRTLVACKKNY